MSHTVTITRTTTTSSGTALFLNTGYLKTTPGLLKLAELILGAVCVGLIAYYFDRRYYNNYDTRPELFFLLTATTFMIGTFCLLTACLVSLSSGSIISKTIYEVIYHGIAFVMYLAAGLTLIIEVHENKNTAYRYKSHYEAYLAASIIGLVLAGLYLFSTILANRSYRGI
ncbi:membrane-associating domain-containing protein [Phthorimaea operculella]|nr:membrane-associating domain-containing protein [Phthorimaea operculella]